MSYFLAIQFFDDEERTKETLNYIFKRAFDEANAGAKMDIDGDYLPPFHFAPSKYHQGYLLLSYEFFFRALGEHIRSAYNAYDLGHHEELYLSPTKNAKYLAAREVLIVSVLERFYRLVSLNSYKPSDYKGQFFRFHHFRRVKYGIEEKNVYKNAHVLPFSVEALSSFLEPVLLLGLRKICEDLDVSQIAFRS
jgi:hypothetical protein